MRVRSKFIEVTIQKRGVLVRVRRLDGSPLMSRSDRAAASGGGVAWDRAVARRRRATTGSGRAPTRSSTCAARRRSRSRRSFSRRSATASITPARGRTASTSRPTTAIASTRRRSITTSITVRRSSRSWRSTTASVGTPRCGRRRRTGSASWATCGRALLRIVQGAMSAMLAPTLDLAPYASAPPELQQRARQLGSLVAEVSPGQLGMSDFRNQLASFFDVYAMEAHEKGYPIWHPLPFQFPDDPECALHADEFMLGDEMLIAPIVAPGNAAVGVPAAGRVDEPGDQRGVPGTADDHGDDAGPARCSRATGRSCRWIRRPAWRCTTSRSSARSSSWSRRMAGRRSMPRRPADIMRLEIESKKARDYEWVVHHVARPVSVGFEGRKFREVNGASRTGPGDTTVSGSDIGGAAAGADSIVNVDFGASDTEVGRPGADRTALPPSEQEAQAELQPARVVAHASRR